MNNNTKKLLSIGYLFILTFEFFLRKYDYTYFEFFYVSFVILLSSSIILKALTRKESRYYIPGIIGIVIAFALFIIGLTQPGDSMALGLLVVLGVMIFGLSIFILSLKKVIDSVLFDSSKKNEYRLKLITSFILFSVYMSMISSRLTNAFDDIGSAVFLIIAIGLLLNVLYFIIHLFIKKILKKDAFDIIYSVFVGIIGISIYITLFENIDSNILANLNVFFISFCMYISIAFIADIFKTINT